MSIVSNRLLDAYYSVVDRGYSIVVLLVAAGLALVCGVLLGMALTSATNGPVFDRLGSSVTGIGGSENTLQGGR